MILVCFKGTHVARTLLVRETHANRVATRSVLACTNRNASGRKRCSQACNKFNSLLCVAMRANGVNAHVNRCAAHALQVSRLDSAYAALGCVLRVGNYSALVAAGH